MRFPLQLSPGAICTAVSGIEVEVTPTAGLLGLRYIVSGVTDALVPPPPAEPVRTDELWRDTCFEAFVRPGPGEAYWEYNLAPSTAWAAYRFDRYRQGMAVAEDAVEPGIVTISTPGGLEVTATLALPGDGPWKLGLSAVIAEADGGRAYWALAHPAERPDFHHPDCFAAELAAPNRS